jgi:exopolyphosphatase/guanosine-5'-triphosphate,3'-diphosphate pyrophosphatase
MPHRHLYAAVDLGSNSFHMLVARREHGELRVIDRIREMVRIAGGLNATGKLDAATRDGALECLARFGQRLADLPPQQIRAVGTQTFRRMADAERFLVVAETALGCPIDIISGREEARLVWLGVTEGTAFSRDARLVIDIGGGSTELAAGRERDPAFVESIQFGCVGVTRRAFGKGKITPKRWRKASDEIATELQALKPEVDRSGWRTAVGSSGTVRAVQAIIAAADDTLPRAITVDDIGRLRRAITEAGHVERVVLPGLSGKRQPVIAGGVLVLESCMHAFGIEKLEVSPFALREGLLYDMVGRLEHRDPREKTVRAMAERFEADAAQAERVRDFALCAFEQIAEAFDLKRIHRDLLDWSCRLHEIGLGIAHSHYQVHSAYVVEHSDMAGFSRQEQQFMAFLLRYQRRKLPTDALETLPARLRPSARPVLAVLRIAVALCRSRMDADLPDFSLIARDGDRLELAVPKGWLAAHPLSSRSLELERGQLHDIGIALRIETLAAPHPMEQAES